MPWAAPQSIVLCVELRVLLLMFANRSTRLKHISYVGLTSCVPSPFLGWNKFNFNFVKYIPTSTFSPELNPYIWWHTIPTLTQVLDARDPQGTRSRYIEGYLRREKPHKHVILLLNKCDLIPTRAVVRGWGFKWSWWGFRWRGGALGWVGGASGVVGAHPH